MSEVVSRCDFAIGDFIDDRYQVSRPLGEGAFGKVFKVVRASGTSESMALKLLKLWEVPGAIRAELQQRFEMEYETGKIKSRYLVQSMGYGMVHGNPYIVMEFCPNGDISKYIPRPGVDQPAPSLGGVALNVLYGLQALQLMLQLGDGLFQFHDLVIHLLYSSCKMIFEPIIEGLSSPSYKKSTCKSTLQVVILSITEPALNCNGFF